ncbi:MAG: hypothetical protein NC191_03630 [Muribaculaceae bacterium]|nr:hypothetical protein [Muribaculaceae bacterium]
MSFQSLKSFALLVLTFFLLISIYMYFNHTYIKAEFKNMDPMPSKMGVYFNGYRLGTTTKLRISKDFKTTYLYIRLNQRGLHLPRNISVKIKNYDEDTKYVDIIYPRAPSIKYIKSGDVIKGESRITFNGISDTNQAHLDNLSEKGENLLASATQTTDSLTEMFDLITDILGENRENIYSSTTSLKNSMANLEDLSRKINDEVTRQTIRNSAQNLEQITANFAYSSKDFISISGNFNKTSSDFSVLIPKLSNLIEAAQMVMCNINDIVVGLKKTLQQKFGGARLIFGKPIKN